MRAGVPQGLRVVLMALVAVAVGGCSSPPQNQAGIGIRYITIITDPAGAAVTQINPTGGSVTNLGSTPITQRPVVVFTNVQSGANASSAESRQLLQLQDTVQVVIRKQGYQDYTGVLATRRDGIAVLKISLTPLAGSPPN